MMSSAGFMNTSSYQLLREHFEEIKNVGMRDMFDADPSRFDNMHIQFENFLFDYSKNRANAKTISLLTRLADELQLRNHIDAMFTGKKINRTENRPVLHTALRNFANEKVFADGIDVMPDVKAVLAKMKKFSASVIDGSRTGFTGKRFTDVVNIGIGGSDLGPVMVTEALKTYKIPHVNLHFVSNVDGTHITETLKKLNPETTLFLIASKTFTTQETMLNAQTAKSWFLQTAGDEKFVGKHFIAISTAKNEVEKFGIDAENMFVFWDWVGGRYSLWSAIGLAICIAIGYDKFEELLRGAHAADLHFRNADFKINIPVLMALLGFWYIDFFDFNAHAVIPYDQYLHRFPAYLQQADMESNGKSIDQNGKRVDYATGPLIWGEPGTNGQHAFFQLLHQGTQIIPADFIGFIQSLNPVGEHHDVLMSNFFAQTEALMKGKTKEEVEKELSQKGMSENEMQFQAPFRVFEGNRPTNTFVIDKLTPYNLGTLIAFYEHKIFVQGILWNIFSFDQWGVELGKKLATKLLPELKSEELIRSHDSSTNGLVNWFKK